MVRQWRKALRHSLLCVYVAYHQVGGEQSEDTEEDRPFHDDASLFTKKVSLELDLGKSESDETDMTYLSPPKGNIAAVVRDVSICICGDLTRNQWVDDTSDGCPEPSTELHPLF